ncbi:MAG: hypothetical protein HOO91_17070 [Bacteroidales bacterium]|nr:hypothetical protein [Bacteroidales bacterium]
MKALDLIATSLNRRDDEPNQALAVEIIRSKRNDWVKELVENLKNKDKNIQSDCIKALYEIGERGSADMIAPYYKEFGEILNSKNNRLIWGTMTALDTITLVNPKGIYDLLPLTISAIDKGSVITIDHGVGILAKLSSIDEYADNTFPLLIEQLKKCPAKQLPMYAEKSQFAISSKNQKQFIELIQSRIPEMDKDSQRVRLNKVLKKIK